MAGREERGDAIAVFSIRCMSFARWRPRRGLSYWRWVSASRRSISRGMVAISS